MFAVIKTGGKQYLLKEKDVIKIEKIEGKVKETVFFDKVLLLFDEKNKEVKIGKPTLEGVRVEAKILEQGRDKKISVIKYKPKVRYRRKIGHRQPYTKVEILKILTE